MKVKYDVYIGPRLVEVVYRKTRDPAREVRKELIEHDDYPNIISVYRYHPTKHAFDDMARATHPEEL